MPSSSAEVDLGPATEGQQGEEIEVPTLAELVAMGLEQLECMVARPPEDARGAFELAVQHYTYCPELMDNLVPALGGLAATLFGRHWLFDWR